MPTKMLKGRNPSALKKIVHLATRRALATPSTSTHTPKAAGDISSVFPSLSGTESVALPARFADQKRRLIQGHEDRLQDSWHRLLAELRKEIEVIRAAGSSIVPEISFPDVKWNNIEKMTVFRDQLRKRGVAIIRGVVSEKEALGWKELVTRYIQTNPSTKGRLRSLSLESNVAGLDSLHFLFSL